MKKKILNLFGLAFRSSNVYLGEEMVVENITKAKICFLASDAGPNTTKKITNKCAYYNVPLYTIFTRSEISSAIGKDRVVIAIKDAGFKNKMEQIMKEGELND